MLLFGWEDWRICAFMVGLFVVPVWLLVLLPLSLWLPASSRLWRPAICTSLGAAAGALLIIFCFAIWPGAPLGLALIVAPIGIVVGGVTCFVGSTTARSFHGTRET
jgi:hypothetical protein